MTGTEWLTAILAALALFGNKYFISFIKGFNKKKEPIVHDDSKLVDYMQKLIEEKDRRIDELQEKLSKHVCKSRGKKKNT